MPADNEPSWLSFDEVVRLNERIVAASGEPFGIIDPGKLEGGLHRCVELWSYGLVEDVFSLALRLFEGVANAHAFLQGNKRTGYFATLIFLRTNGKDVRPSDTLIVAKLFEDVVLRRPDAEEKLMGQFKADCRS